MTEDKARRAMMDAAKLAEDLRLEQEHTTRADGERRAMEAQVKDLQVSEIHICALIPSRRMTHPFGGSFSLCGLNNFKIDISCISGSNPASHAHRVRRSVRMRNEQVAPAWEVCINREESLSRTFGKHLGELSPKCSTTS